MIFDLLKKYRKNFVLTSQQEVDKALADPQVKELNIVIPEGVLITLGSETKTKTFVSVSGPGRVILNGGNISTVSDGGNVILLGRDSVVQVVEKTGVIDAVGEWGKVVNMKGLVHAISPGGYIGSILTGGVVEYAGIDSRIYFIQKGGTVMYNHGGIYLLDIGGKIGLNRGIIEVPRGTVDHDRFV